MTVGPSIEIAPGLLYVRSYLAPSAQGEILRAIREVIAVAPLFQPRMPKSGAPFSVRISNCGSLGWVSDREGYRYVPIHPGTGRAWPPMPAPILAAWDALARYSHPAEACLINYYDTDARMGLHQDRDEDALDAPVVSLSLGDACIFRYGGTSRRGPTKSVTLASGDALVLSGASRLAFHGVDRLLGGSSGLLAEGGRFNLTLRRVTRGPV